MSAVGSESCPGEGEEGWALSYGLGLDKSHQEKYLAAAGSPWAKVQVSLQLPQPHERTLPSEGTSALAGGVFGDVCLPPSALCPTSWIGTWSEKMGQWVTLHLLVSEAFSHQRKYHSLWSTPGLVTPSAYGWAVPGEVPWSPSGLILCTTGFRSLCRSFAL